MIAANPNATIKLYWQSKLGDETLYPQAVIKDSDGTTITTVSLTHDSNGAYHGTTTSLVTEGTYSCQYLPYEDSGHTSLSGVDEITGETISIMRSWRPSFGGGGEAVIPPTILDNLLARFNIIEDTLKNLDEKIDKKSEFNPSIDKVTTNLRVPNYREMQNSIESKIKELSLAFKDNKNIDNTGKILNEFAKIKTAIGNIKQNDVNVDLTPILGKLSSLSNDISKIKQPDLSSIKSGISDIISEVRAKRVIKMITEDDIDNIASKTTSPLTEQVAEKMEQEVSNIIDKMQDKDKLFADLDKKSADRINKMLKMFDKVFIAILKGINDLKNGQMTSDELTNKVKEFRDNFDL